MTDTEYKALLTSGGVGAFLFYGDEGYLKEHWLKTTRKQLVSEGDTFNHIILNGVKSIDKLLDAIEQPPFMAEKKLIELHEVEYSELSSDVYEALCACGDAVKAQGDTTLILYTLPDEFDSGTLPKKPSPAYKKLTASFEPVEFAVVTAGKLSAWAGRHFAHERIIAEPRQIQRLIDRCGESMQILASEIEKLCCYLHSLGRDRLSDEDVDLVTVTGIDNDAFAVSNALLGRNKDAALAALAEMKANHTDPIIATAGIIKVICDMAEISRYLECGLTKDAIAKKKTMHPYRVGLHIDAVRRWGDGKLADALDMCMEADLSLKTNSKGYLPAEILLARLFS
ncbi:MAG: DNA polymerase III subunit delta [Clostridia bacterium]|nr:DNA polymerase III subunit delta [Clostridia bacterium]